MAKTILGIDLGCDSLKLALCSGGKLKKHVSVSMPQNLIKEGRLVSPETLGELIRSVMKENGINCRNAAVVLPNDVVYLRNVTMPRMTDEQLRYNLPYEFRDYISDELKNYAFDYAMITPLYELLGKKPDEMTKGKKPKKGKKGEPKPAPESEPTPAPEPSASDEAASTSMELMAVAVPLAVIEEYRVAIRKAGLKLVKLAPSVSAYQELLRRAPGEDADKRESCILDLGHQSIRMYMFKGERHMVTRMLEVGLNSLDQVIADSMSVDEHLAHTYLLTHHENCQNSESCRNTYGNIAVELMRALNFYHFSDPTSTLNDVWLCGGGAALTPLREIIAETLDMNIHSASELLPDGDAAGDSHIIAKAVGITMVGD